MSSTALRAEILDASGRAIVSGQVAASSWIAACAAASGPERGVGTPEAEARLTSAGAPEEARLMAGRRGLWHTRPRPGDSPRPGWCPAPAREVPTGRRRRALIAGTDSP